MSELLLDRAGRRRSPATLRGFHAGHAPGNKGLAAFDPRDYGHTKLGELVRAESYVEVKDVPGPTGLSQLWVRLKPTGPKGARTR
jgi:hypothetical protein